MKKLLTALLVVVMMLSLCGAAFAFTDTADLSKDAQGSVSKLSGLSIINGYPDGTFKPANNITRAEFAKIACVAGGMEASAEVLKSSPSKFSDVKAGEWFTGYVNLANSQGWVKGFPDGTFRPNAKISYAEVITVLTRLLGYNDNLPGPWPVDYIAKAGSLDITEDVAFDANAAATRGDVAVMTDSTLDCDVVKWDNDTEDFEEENFSLLEDNFESAVNGDYYIQDAKYDDGTWSIKVESTTDDDEALDDYDETAGVPTHGGTWIDLADEAVFSNGAPATWLGGNLADILYNDDDDEVVYIDLTSTKVTVDGADWDYDSGEYEIDGKTYDVADWTTGTLITTFNATTDDQFIRAYLNSDDEVFKTAVRTDASAAIVDEYKETTEKLTFKHRGTYWAAASSIDFTDEDVLIEKDSKFIELKDLTENDVIYIDENCYGYDYYIDVWGQITTEGKFQSYKDQAIDQVKIDGTWYDVAPDTSLSRNGGADFDDKVMDNATNKGLEDTYGETVKYFLNKANQVVFMISDVDGSGDDSTTIYGVVTDIVDINNVTKKISKVKVMKKDGTEASFVVDTDEVELLYKGSTGDTFATNELDVDDFVKFSVNDNNEIDSLTILAYWDSIAAPKVIKDPIVAGSVSVKADYTDADNSDYHGTITDGDTDNDRIQFAGNWYDVTDATVVFNANLDDALGSDDDEADIEKNADFVDWAENLAGAVTAYVQVSGGDVEYVFLHDAVAASDADYAVILDNYISDGDKWVDVDILGEKKEYELKNGTAPVEGGLYEYTVSSSKFEYSTVKFNPTTFKATATLNDVADSGALSVGGAVYDVVTDVKTSTKGVEINDVWYYADDDTIIYDYSDWYDDGDDPVFSKEVGDINEDDYIIFIDNGDGKNIAEMFIIVNNID